jgi:hypothetical protein
MWNVGVLLQSDEPLDVLTDDFRPWPRFRANEEKSIALYVTLERNKCCYWSQWLTCDKVKSTARLHISPVHRRR